MHDPKFGPSWATTYLTDPTPGRHTAGGVALHDGDLLALLSPLAGG